MTISESDRVTGLSYFWQINPATTGLLTLINRNTTGSPLSDFITSNNDALNPSDATLSPRNTKDLGAVTNDPYTAIENGEWFVASYTFQANAFMLNGIYSLNLTGATDGTTAIWSGPAPDFDSYNVTEWIPIDITVVPEPHSMTLALGACALLALRRQRIQRTSNRVMTCSPF
ncbi:MAG: hypothetical protein B9S32_04195 [Verrucomicrobia bacterium Tous-C9LFEB]|nr:MAG: hypothetical protein B9S32_04195 [Verrucomicrobia bacterium Tous-C9LFEB]